MIISFRFKNFRSFLDETFVDMKAVNYKEHPDHLVMTCNKKLLKTLAIYGANSSGKTNLFLAFTSFHSFIFWQLFSMEYIPRKHFMSFLKISSLDKILPFLDEKINTQPTEMELTFINEQRIYEYGFSVLNGNVLTENLAVDNHMVYTRNGDEITIGRHYEKVLHQKTGIRPHEDRLFCSILTCLDIPEIRAIMEPFESFFSKQIAYYCDFLEPFHLAGQVLDGRTYKVLENPKAISYALGQLRKLGIPAEELIIEKGIPKLGYRVKSRDTGEYHMQYMEYTKVSLGTMKYLQLFIQVYHLTQGGGVLIIDNISNEFHPSVTKFFIDTFQKNKNLNIQIIFTTYDISILNNQQFRRDEVAFVDMNEYHESRLYTLADIKVRSDASFSKDYLLGKYGAIPLLKESIL